MAKVHIANRIESVNVDVADNSTTVHTGPCRLHSIHVITALSAHAVPINDDATQLFNLPAAASEGSIYRFWGAKFGTSLVIDPNDVGTGSITVTYEPL